MRRRRRRGYLWLHEQSLRCSRLKTLLLLPLLLLLLLRLCRCWCSWTLMLRRRRRCCCCRRFHPWKTEGRRTAPERR